MAVSFKAQQDAIIARLVEIINEAWSPDKVHLGTPETVESQSNKRQAFCYLMDMDPSDEGGIGEECADLVFEIVLHFPKAQAVAEVLQANKRLLAENLRVALTTERHFTAGNKRYHRSWRGETYLASDSEMRQQEASSSHATVSLRFCVEGVRGGK